MTDASALLFGSIGTLAETSELQRRAFNRAFADAGLDWVWDRTSYLRLLRKPGGVARIAAYAADSGDEVDASALHSAKVRHFAELIDREGLCPRPGVVEMLRSARSRGMRTALCTTTIPDQVDAVLDGLANRLSIDLFDWIGDATRCARRKPAPDIYNAALGRLDVAPERVLTIEDTPESGAAALAVGCRLLAFPGEAAAQRDFQPGVLVVDRLQPRLLDMLAPETVAASAAA